MNTFVMRGADQSVLLHHMALYGLADILDTEGAGNVKLTWDSDRPVIIGDQLSPEAVEGAVRAHLEKRRVWVKQTNGNRAVMSPRLTTFKDEPAWQAHQAERERVLVELTLAQAWPDLRYLAALGEPSYWRFNRQGAPLQDDGASRFEMQPRNQGSEFVGNRLRPLIANLLARKRGAIVAGLNNDDVVDELGGKANSVSATGLTTPGPVDNALVWCALWGIGQLPLALRLNGPAVTSGHLGRSRREWFYTPVWRTWWRPARLRTILASAQLAQFATAGTGLPEDDPATNKAAAAWLEARGVVGALRFPIGRFGSDNAPERRALRGEAMQI